MRKRRSRVVARERRMRERVLMVVVGDAQVEEGKVNWWAGALGK